MAYYIDLFSTETYQAFSNSSRDISGFRERHRSIAAKINPGDHLVCYVTRLSRWVGVLEVIKGPFIDHSRVFVAENDPIRRPLPSKGHHLVGSRTGDPDS